MQLMLSLYEFPHDGTTAGTYSKELVVDYMRGYRRIPG
jgi:hypothetical protein